MVFLSLLVLLIIWRTLRLIWSQIDINLQCLSQQEWLRGAQWQFLLWTGRPAQLQLGGKGGSIEGSGHDFVRLFPLDCQNFNMLEGGVIMLKYALHCYCATMIIMHTEMWVSTDAAWGNLGLDYRITGFYRLTYWWLISVPEESVSSLVVVLQGCRAFPILNGFGAFKWIATSTWFKDSGGLWRSRALQYCPSFCRWKVMSDCVLFRVAK